MIRLSRYNVVTTKHEPTIIDSFTFPNHLSWVPLTVLLWDTFCKTIIQTLVNDIPNTSVVNWESESLTPFESVVWRTPLKTVIYYKIVISDNSLVRYFWRFIQTYSLCSWTRYCIDDMSFTRLVSSIPRKIKWSRTRSNKTNERKYWNSSRLVNEKRAKLIDEEV